MHMFNCHEQQLRMCCGSVGGFSSRRKRKEWEKRRGSSIFPSLDIYNPVATKIQSTHDKNSYRKSSIYFIKYNRLTFKRHGRHDQEPHTRKHIGSPSIFVFYQR